jgi:hypothetical protein
MALGSTGIRRMSVEPLVLSALDDFFSKCELPHISRPIPELFYPSVDGWAVHLGNVG